MLEVRLLAVRAEGTHADWGSFSVDPTQNIVQRNYQLKKNVNVCNSGHMVLKNLVVLKWESTCFLNQWL